MRTSHSPTMDNAASAPAGPVVIVVPVCSAGHGHALSSVTIPPAVPPLAADKQLQT